MKEILENHFETVYKEFKEYETFLKSAAKEIKEQNEKFTQFTVDNKDNIDAITSELFEIQSKPHFYQNDLVKLLNRLIHTYEAVKEVIEIPEDIKKEISNFIKPKQFYRIENGNAVEIDTEFLEKSKEEAKKHYTLQVKQLLSQN